MHAPTVENLEALERVARYFIGHGRLVQEFVRQVEEPSHVVVFTNSDHAGCLKTRKGTSSSYGSHMLRSTSTTQGVVALSSGESEFYNLVKGTSAGLGAVSMLKELGVDNCNKTKIDNAVLEVRVDASAGRGIAVRRGAGRIRHIATPTIVGTQAHARRHSQNHENPWSLETGRSWNLKKSHPEVFTVDNACEVDTQSETEMESQQY